MAKKCLHCGDSMPEEANICLHCFTICDNTASDSENAKTKKRKKPTKKQIAILVTAVACLLVILPLGAMQIDQAIAPTTSANTAASNANTNAKENNPVSRFFKKVLGIEEEAEDTDTSNGAPNGGKGQSAPNTTDVAANNNASASKENTESNNTIQNKPSGSGSDNNTSASTEPEEEETPILNYSDYEYETDYDGEIKITKYTGNDSCIMIPDQINGIDVGSIEQYAFKDNNTLQTVYFKDSENYHILWVKTYAFYNCKNLKKVVFPKNTDLGILPVFALLCPKMEEIEVEHWQYRFLDGGLYYYSGGWSLCYYCEGCTASVYRVPDWCGGIAATECFEQNPYVKTIYMNETTACLQSYTQCPALEAIIVPDSNPYYMDVDGVLFKKMTDGTLSLYLYPAQKKDKTFTFPENSKNSLAFAKNEYVETLRFPKTAIAATESNAEHIKSFYKSLKTIYLEKGHPQTEIIKYHSNFLGEVIEY